MFRNGELATFDLFALGAARLSERLARLDELEQGQAGAAASTASTNNNNDNNTSDQPRWRWVERRAPVTGARTGVLELERWLPAAAACAASDPAAVDPASAAVEPVEDEAAVQGGQATYTRHHHRYVFHAAHSAVYRAPVLCFRAERADGAPLPPEQVRADLSPWLQMHGPPAAVREGGGRRGEEETKEEEEQEEDKSSPPPPRGRPSSPPRPSSPASPGPWEFYLARGEHPAGPFPGAPAHIYYLHPCRTAERMALLMGSGAPEAGGRPSPPLPRAGCVGASGEEEQEASVAEAASRYLAAWLSAVAPAVGLPRLPQPEETACRLRR